MEYLQQRSANNGKGEERVAFPANGCCAICVTYNPDPELLQKAASACAQQVERMYIIDNGSEKAITSWPLEFENIECVFFHENKGIAAAINAGVNSARAAGFRYVLLLDQDSVTPESMVRQYLSMLEHLLAIDQPIAAIGPRYKNSRTGQLSKFVRFKWFRNSYQAGTGASPIVPTDFLISSGSFYPIDIFDKVGHFDEDLFIDHVDTEWCLRAEKLGFRCYGVRDVVMEHSLGEGEIRLWLFRWRTQPMHKPFRLYYIARNSILLYRMKHVPLKWISGDVLRLIRLLLMYALFSPQRLEAICYFFRGLLDGIQKVAGPVPSVR
ncbi:MAG: glycosyltransferase family 2 protein [Desulfobulbus sp.]|nr:glycosyltransferase family 2 protein [Desulfobulbus sp.]